MARDRRKLQHIHSSIADRQPTPATLAVGEIAVNNADKKEFLSIKSSNDNVVRFSRVEQLIVLMVKTQEQVIHIIHMVLQMQTFLRINHRLLLSLTKLQQRILANMTK